MASMALTGCSVSNPARHAKAKIISATYSMGPKASAQRASSGAASTMPTVAMAEPTNEVQAESDRAMPALPSRARG